MATARTAASFVIGSFISAAHAANIIDAAQAQGWSLVVLVINWDLSTAAGRMMARTVVNFAEYERELISDRTKAGLAAKKLSKES